MPPEALVFAIVGIVAGTAAWYLIHRNDGNGYLNNNGFFDQLKESRRLQERTAHELAGDPDQPPPRPDRGRGFDL